jgi:moderate conductance mechanosensitive channel
MGALWIRRGRTLRGMGLAAIAMVLVTLPAWGQLPSPTPSPTKSAPPALASPAPSPTPVPSPTKSALPSLISIGATTTPGVATAKVNLDGRDLFTIAAPAVREQTNPATSTPPIRDRVTAIETALTALADSQFDPKGLKVKSEVDPKSGQPVITANDRYLMTVTTLDAQLQGQDPVRQADEFVRTIEPALQTARRERQPEFLIRQGWVTALILSSMVIASWVVAQVQRQIQRQIQRQTQHQSEHSIKHPERSQPDPTAEPAAPPTSPTAITQVQTQIQQRQQRSISDTRRRLLQLLQLLIWGSGIYAIVGLFPHTRWVQLVLFSVPLKILGILLLTYGVIRVSNVLLDRFFSTQAVEDLVAPESSQRLALRLSTFSWVLRNVISIVALGAGLLGVLAAIGVDLMPILAGAGIFGLAVSFASQNLIKDVINGLLILYEDQYAVGDMIQVGKVSGLVEYMNLRITQLRNAEGRLITIPNSSIVVVENLSKDWSRVDLALTIAYNADLDAALALIHQVGQAMSQDPIWQDKIAEPPSVLGVEDFNSAGITVRIWVKTVPLEQWKVAREFRRRLKLALDRHQIAIGGLAPIVPANPSTPEDPPPRPAEEKPPIPDSALPHGAIPPAP